jgi:hypothetical protein
MRRLYMAIVACVGIGLLISGCGKAGASPKDILAKYLDASLHGRMAEAYEYISQKDKAVVTVDEYIEKQIMDENNVFAESLATKISYKINEITVNSNKADAKVSVSMPDFSVMFSDVMSAAFMLSFGGSKGEDISKMMAEKYKDKEIPMTTMSKSYALIKESDGWRVFLDLERQERVATLLGEAGQLRKDKKLKGALKKYEEVLELDSKEVTAKLGKNELPKEISKFEEKQAYIDKVKLYDFTAKYFSTYLDGKTPGVTFKIKNDGDKTLTNVKVTVYFKDASNNIIAEDDYRLVLASEYSFGDNKPLKPNYIWQMEQGKFYTAKSVPSEWQEGNAVAKITDIEFEE